MVRGVRGAITVKQNEENEIIEATKRLFTEMIKKNNIEAEEVAQVLISVTEELDAVFPAKALRQFQGWEYVPIMCTCEIPVQNSLRKCIRVMMTVNTDKGQKDIQHIYLEEAIKLRPDLSEKESK